MLHTLRIHKLAMIAVAAVVAACAGPQTTVDQVWTSPTARAQPPLRRVVTVFISNNMTMRHSGEDHLARQLQATGVEATPGYAVLGDQPQDMQNLEAMKTKLRGLGYDGIVTMRIVDREQQVEAVPSSFDWYWGYWGPSYWGSYGSYWPGYIYTETIYRLEAAAYSLQTGQLMWSATTKTVDPDSSHELVDDTTEIIASQLTRRGLAG